MNEDERQALRAEFELAEGTFLAAALKGKWEPVGFANLMRLMRRACVAYENAASVEKWLPSGFHMLLTQQKRFGPKPQTQHDAFVSNVSEHIMLLADWFFTGDCPLNGGEGAFEHELTKLLASH